MKKIIALLLALCMVFALAACGSSGEKPADNKPSASTPDTNEPAKPAESEEPLINFDEDPYEVSIQFIGLFEQNTNIANVEAALNEITLPAINVTVDIVPVFIGDMGSVTSLGVAGDEKLDIVAAGLVTPMTNMVADEVLLPLDDLLAERGPAALAVTEKVAAAQKMNGATYALTGYPYSAMSGGFVYNKTMAEEYGIKMFDGMTMDDLTAAAKILKEHGVYLTTMGGGYELNYKFLLGGEHFGNGTYGGIFDPVNSTEIVNVYDAPEMREYWTTVKSWCDAGYLPGDQLTDTVYVQEHFQAGNIFGTATAYTANQLASWSSSNFETDIVSTSPVTISTGSVQEFMLGIAANCERPDKAMDLINLIYANAEVGNLLMYGVEGTDYRAVEGTENVITRADTPNADGNSYSASFVKYGNPLEQKVLAPLTDSVYDDIRALEEKAQTIKCFGYVFDSADFSAESAAISNVLQEQIPRLNAGVVADVDKAVDELVAALEKAGINDVIAANQEQLNAFLGK